MQPDPYRAQKELEEKMEEMKKELENKNSSFFDFPDIKKKLSGFKDIFVVFLLIIFFNVSSVDEFLRFKKYSIFYDIQDDKSTLLFTFFKAMIITSIYYMVTSLIK